MACTICGESKPSEFYPTKSKKFCKKCHIVKTMDARHAKKLKDSEDLESGIIDPNKKACMQDLDVLYKDLANPINTQHNDIIQLKRRIEKQDEKIRSLSDEIDKLKGSRDLNPQHVGFPQQNSRNARSPERNRTTGYSQ